MIISTCPTCGAELTRTVIDLGRESESRVTGDEGHEFFASYSCPSHGAVRPVEVQVCDHCRRPAREMTVVSDGEQEFPVTHCSPECLAALTPVIGGFKRADFVRWQYVAKPARDGKIHRLQCRCGELADGNHWRADNGDITAYRCDRCLPKK